MAVDDNFSVEKRRHQIVRSRQQNGAFLVGALTLLLFALFPGRFDGDSISQHLMGVTFSFHDWHSPLMSAAFGVLSDVASGPGPMFVVQLVVWILGLAILTDTLIERGHPVVGQAISVISVMPLVSFNFLEVQKDSLFTALVAVFIGLGVRSLFRRPAPTVISVVCSIVLLVFALDVRTNGFFIFAGLVFLYFPVRSWSWSRTARAAALGAAALGLGLSLGSWLDHDVLKASRTYSLYSLIVFDLAGISYNSQSDASEGLLPDFAGNASRCYTPTGADPFLWGACNIRDDLDRMVRTDSSRLVLQKRWIASIVQHPVSYLTHRISHFGCYIRVGCGDFRWPMTPGLSYRREWDSETPRISHLGRFIEGLAMKSYAGPLMNGGVLILLFIIEILVAGALLRRGFEPIAYIALVLATSALLYELAFFVVGVSAAQRYVHVVAFVAGLSLPLSIAAVRLRGSRLDAPTASSGAATGALDA